MHTVEVSSSEVPNTYDSSIWPSTSKEDYVYATINHSGWPLTGRPRHHQEEGSGSTREARPHVYGTINLHSDSTRITSEENPVYGTVRQHPLPEKTNNRRGKWTDVDPSFEGNGNSIEKEYGEGLDSELPPDYMMPDSVGAISSRGGRHADSPMNDNSRMTSHGFVQDDNTTRDPHSKGDILGKGTRDSLEFEWQMTNWSECSQTCGFTSTSSGYQVRSIQCLARVKNVTSPVDGALCDDAGLEAPVTYQRCGFTECPQWHFGEWSECESSRCFTLHYAYQRREVVCQLHNGTIVSNLQCDNRTRPRHRQECYNYQCSGVWRVGDWSECTAPCGGQGYRTRLLQCVWNGTKKAAGNACRELPRPDVVRWCSGDPCPDLSEEDSQDMKGCRDQSKYCNIVKRTNMCRIQSYQQQCCRSCP